jgi:hypothetical protein
MKTDAYQDGTVTAQNRHAVLVRMELNIHLIKTKFSWYLLIKKELPTIGGGPGAKKLTTDCQKTTKHDSRKERYDDHV